jgi:hypothetical protein
VGGQNGPVVSTAVQPGPSVAGHRLRYLGSFFAAGLGLSALYATTGAGLPCPFRTFTGWDCPLCGGTRMGGALLHGDLTAAFAFNPVALVGLVVLGAVGSLWLVELAGGPRVRGPEGLRRRLATVRPNQWVVLGVAAAVVYTVVRNLL